MAFLIVADGLVFLRSNVRTLQLLKLFGGKSVRGMFISRYLGLRNQVLFPQTVIICHGIAECEVIR